MYVDFWFRDEESGEEFFVELDATASLDDAMEIATEYFEEPHFISLVSPEYAEMMGYDTY